MAGAATAERLERDFGPQGGDPRRRQDGVRLDLSTCVNRYGPPPAALAALVDLTPADIQVHPYDAAERLEATYADHLGVDPSQLVAGRGTTEFIWALGRQVPHEAVAVPLPAYTDYLKAFPGRGFAGFRLSPVPTLELIDEAMAHAGLVILSNPHNPTGVALPPQGLVEVASHHPRSVLVVDESYTDFVPRPERLTVIGSAPPNVVALRSPSKFYGIAATRAGVAWAADGAWLRRLLGRRETWPVSGLDVVVAEAAMASRAWAEDSRLRLGDDGRWLAAALASFAERAAGPDSAVVVDAPVHYRCLLTPVADRLAATFARHGLGVRALGRAHGVHPGALRILAPLTAERPAVAEILAAVAGADALLVGA
jgi:histidinol-phosphate aminotransferase